MSLNEQIANLIVEKGRAQAAGALGAGQAWSGALSQIGQGVGSAIAGIPKAQEQAKITADAQRARDARDAFSEAMKPENVPDIVQGGVKLKDVGGIGSYMSGKGFGAEFAPAAQHLDAVNQSMQQFQQARENVVKTGAVGLLAADAPLPLIKNYLDHLSENQVYAPDTIKTWQDEFEAHPENAKKILQTIAGQQKLEKVGPDESLVNPIDPTHPVFTAPPKPGEGQHVVNGQVVGPDGQPVGPQVPKQVTPLSDEEKALKLGQLKEINAKLSGTLPMSEKDKGELLLQRARLNAEVTHWKAEEAAANPLAGITGGAAAAPGPNGQPANPTGADVLKNLAPPIAAQVKALAEGRMQFPGGFALKSPYWQSMISLVGQYDPSFDATNYGNRAKTRADFSSGKSAQTINALNTVAQHLDRLSTSADGLANSSLPAYNTIANLISKATGNPAVTKFETDKKAVVDELTRAWRQAGGTESDIKSWSQVLDSSGSPAQLHTAIGEMGNLLEGKLSAMETQLKQGMGPATDLKAITPEARATLDKLKAKGEGNTAAGVIPDNVSTALKGAAPGKHTLSDGSVWTIASDGTITKGS